jgi:regulator of protease activity HflC (stomatin/prohibitin superfamily)
VLTRDGRILHLEATLNFEIEDPKAFAFNFAQPEKVLTTAFESAITHAALEMTMEELQSKLQLFIEDVKNRTKELAKQYGLGVKINGVYIRSADVELPFMIRTAYKGMSSSKKNAGDIIQQEKNKARQTVDAIIDDENSTNPSGEVAVILSQAKGQAVSTMREVEALRQRFYSIHGGEKEGTPARSMEARRRGMHRLYFEVFNRLMTESDLKIYVISNRSGPRQKVHLLINPKPPEPKKSPNDDQGRQQGPPGGGQ